MHELLTEVAAYCRQQQSPIEQNQLEVFTKTIHTNLSDRISAAGKEYLKSTNK
jgi:hypothetical protein